MAPPSVLSFCLGGVVMLAGIVLPIIWMVSAEEVDPSWTPSSL